ncbi:MAG: glycosyltransferase family 9 protein [Bacteroidales bacterium]|nr:glycosyltransferase family 9 protein [Bacteroidales bacterium]
MVAKIANLADSADIPIKIGTTHRLFTWLFCNQPVWFSRKQSDLHEAQFNLKLLKPLGIKVMLRREEIPDYYGLKVEGRGSRVEERRTKDEGRGIRNTKYEIQTQDPASGIEQPCHCEDPDYPGDAATASRFKLILHPKSKGSAREWGLENFSRLIGLLPKNRFRIYITGTKDEGEMMKEFLEKHRDDVTDMTGKMTLSEFMDFIRECDGLVAASTGPLHLAAAFGKVAVGLYAPMRPIYPTRWAPLGEKASYLVAEKECNDCRKGGDCHCMKDIRAEEVAAMFLSH